MVLRNVHAVTLSNARVFLGDIQRIHQAGIGEDAEGLRVVGIEAADLAGVVGVAPELVNGAAQPVAVIQAIQRNALEFKALRLGEGILLHERHRRVRRANEAASAGLAPSAVAGGVHQRKIRRHSRALVPLQFAYPRTPARPAAVRRVAFLALAPAGHALVTIMRAIGIGNGPDDRVLVGQLGQTRELLADLDAGYVGLDGPEFAADLLGRLGLEVEEIQMRRTAGQVNINHRLVRAAGFLRGLHLEQLPQRKPARGHTADLQKIPARIAIAMAAAVVTPAKQINHDAG